MTSRYKLVAPIGRGAFGQVWRAKDAKSAKDVAVKVVKSPRVKDSMVKEEVRHLQAISHGCAQHNVVCYKGTAPFGSRLGIVMDLAPGVPMSKLKSAVTAPRLRKWGRQLFDALDFLHSHGVVHRDVKPANIMVDGDELILIDLGIACSPCPHVYPGVTGTPHYMLPELRDKMEGGKYVSTGLLRLGDYYSAAKSLREATDSERVVAELKAIQSAAKEGDVKKLKAAIVGFTRSG